MQYCATYNKPTPWPYAREVDGLVFDQRECWEKWRANRNQAQVGQLKLDLKGGQHVMVPSHTGAAAESG